MPKQKEPHAGKVIHVRADGTIVESMAGVVIPPETGFYNALARQIERMAREGYFEEHSTQKIV